MSSRQRRGNQGEQEYEGRLRRGFELSEKEMEVRDISLGEGDRPVPKQKSLSA